MATLSARGKRALQDVYFESKPKEIQFIDVVGRFESSALISNFDFEKGRDECVM